MNYKFSMLAFLFLNVITVTSPSTENTEAIIIHSSTTARDVGIWVKNKIIDTAKNTAQTVRELAQEVVKAVIGDALANTFREFVVQPIIFPNASPHFPLVEKDTYDFIFKSYLLDFLAEYIPKQFTDPKPFLDCISLNPTISIKQCCDNLEQACIQYNINPALLAQTFFHYKHEHGYKDRLKSCVQQNKSLLMIITSWLARCGVEVAMHTKPYPAKFFINKLNNNLQSILIRFSLNTFLPTDRNSIGKKVWDYCLKSSPSTLQKAHIVGALSSVVFQLCEMSNYINIAEKIQTKSMLSFSELLLITLMTFICWSEIEGMQKSLDSFEQSAFRYDSFMSALQSYSY